ncbi:interferon-induced protein 44-like isoform X2 [Clupea harengus]|uniref:Interferon-induced protein 44-like isoform X2 n=1 Tax=Clupea harengus TaxID=7950 RepID=A0A6P8G3S4_CLUHA|nr:interferon-induced protein 44-like isoform X2 [Clupea harengus]
METTIKVRAEREVNEKMAEKTDDTVKIPGFTFRSINPPPSSTSSAPVPSDSGATEAHSQSLFLPKIRGKKVVETPAFTLPFNASQNAWPSFQESPWRQVDWSEETKEVLMESVRSYKPACDSVAAARVLLVGPVGAGKSSFISSVQSMFYGRVMNRAMVGSSSSSSTSFTKQLQSFQLHGSRERDGKSMALVLSDMAGLGETNSPTLHDMLATIKGRVPEGHTFSACSPVGSLHVKEPHLVKKVHCVVFVISALELSSYSQTMTSTFQQLREHISALGVHQVALLTHVDKLGLASDITQVYRSSPLKHAMVKAGDLLGLPVSSIVPVKNYSEELELEPHTDTLLLKALDHILQYVELHFRDHPQGPQQADDADSAVSFSSRPSSLEN